MVKDMTAVVAAAGPHRGIGYKGQMVRQKGKRNGSMKASRLSVLTILPFCHL